MEDGSERTARQSHDVGRDWATRAVLGIEEASGGDAPPVCERRGGGGFGMCASPAAVQHHCVARAIVGDGEASGGGAPPATGRRGRGSVDVGQEAFSLKRG